MKQRFILLIIFLQALVTYLGKKISEDRIFYITMLALEML